MAQTTGTNVTKAGIVNDFQSVVRAVASAGIEKIQGTQPNRYEVDYHLPGGGGGNWDNSYHVTGGHPDDEMSLTVPPGPTTGDLTDLVDASQLAGVMRDFAYNLTKIRKTVFEITGTAGLEIVEGPFVSNLADSYRIKYAELDAAAASYQVLSSYLIKASTLNSYLVNIKDIYNQARNTTATVSNCHSNCHSSCHGSRNRR